MAIKMSKFILAHLGLLLLALHLLSSQVAQAQNATDAHINATMSSYNITPTALVNVTIKHKSEMNSSEGLDAFTLLLPLALALSLLHSWA